MIITMSLTGIIDFFASSEGIILTSMDEETPVSFD